MTTNELLEKLSLKYPSPAWSFITQVRSCTGYTNSIRTADALAMSLWPSRGLELIGFELKVSRSDWLHELKQPEKAEEIYQFCDKWYLIISDESIIQDGELPSTWGLMIANGRGGSIKIKKESPQLTPSPLDKPFLASIMRNLKENMISQELIKDKIKIEVKKETAYLENDKKNLEYDISRLKEKIKSFEKISGVNITDYYSGNIGEAVKMVLDGKHLRVEEELKKLRTKAENITKYIDSQINSYEI